MVFLGVSARAKHPRCQELWNPFSRYEVTAVWSWVIFGNFPKIQGCCILETRWRVETSIPQLILRIVENADLRLYDRFSPKWRTYPAGKIYMLWLATLGLVYIEKQALSALLAHARRFPTFLIAAWGACLRTSRVYSEKTNWLKPGWV